MPRAKTAKTLYLLCGLPGAGKTTRSHELVRRSTALHLCADEWVLGLGMSLVDYEFRTKLQDCMLQHARQVLRSGLSVVIEFGSWSHAERDAIRKVGVEEGAATELHFLDAPIDELVRRVRARGGPAAEELASKVLLQESQLFERPTPAETALFDRYIGPDEG
jgi:predicted kinase